jgi:hypothetical protein
VWTRKIHPHQGLGLSRFPDDLSAGIGAGSEIAPDVLGISGVKDFDPLAPQILEINMELGDAFMWRAQTLFWFMKCFIDIPSETFLSRLRPISNRSIGLISLAATLAKYGQGVRDEAPRAREGRPVLQGQQWPSVQLAKNA